MKRLYDDDLRARLTDEEFRFITDGLDALVFEDSNGKCMVEVLGFDDIKYKSFEELRQDLNFTMNEWKKEGNW